MNRAASILWATSVALVLSATPVFAGIKVPVKMPSSKAVANGAGTATKTGDRLHVPGDGKTEYLERTGTGTAGTPIKVLPTIDYSIPRTIDHAKGLLKSNLGQLVLTGVIMGAVSAVDWVMEEGVKPGGGTERKLVKKQAGTVNGIGLPFKGEVSGGFGCTSARSLGPGVYVGSGWVYVVSAGVPYTNSPFTYVGDCNGIYLSQAFDFQVPIVVSPDSTVEVTPEEIDQKFGEYASMQDSEWLKGLLQEACNGSQSPDACFDSLADQSYLTGPSIVAGPSTSTLVSSPQGVKQVVSQTNYKIVYGDNYFTYSPSKVTTIYNPDGTTETQTEEETEDSPDEETVTAPELGDPYKPVVDKYDSIAQEVKDSSPALPKIGYQAWYSFGGTCTPLNLNLPIIGAYTIDYCPYIYDWVRPIIAFFMALWTWHRAREMWEEALRVGRPI